MNTHHNDWRVKLVLVASLEEWDRPGVSRYSYAVYACFPVQSHDKRMNCVSNYTSCEADALYFD